MSETPGIYIVGNEDSERKIELQFIAKRLVDLYNGLLEYIE